MNFQSWKFDRLDGRKQLHTSDCGVFVLEIAMEIIFGSLPIIDLRYWIASQYVSHNFPRSIPTRIKTKIERITMAPRSKIVAYTINVWNDKSVTCYCVLNCIYLALWSWSAWRSSPLYEKLSVVSIFGHCATFPQNFGQVLAQIILSLVKCESFLYSCVPNAFYFVLGSSSGGGSA